MTNTAIKTLLVTDLVDSTRLVESLGDARAIELLRRHDELARRLLLRFEGREIDKSDGFLLLFDRPIHALQYAVQYHRELARLSRQEDVEIASRVGIHLGEVFLFENPPEQVARGAKPLEVEGLAKSTCARLMSLAQGGQTLLSRGAFQLARRALAELGEDGDMEWRDHGGYLFKGIAQPVRVFELGIKGIAPLTAPADQEKAHHAPMADRPRRRDAGAEPAAAGGPAARSPAGRAMRWLAAAAAGAAVLVAVSFRSISPRHEPAAPQTSVAPADSRSVAVLYFDVLASDPGIEWLRYGITDMIVTDLARFSEIEVLSTDRLYQILRDLEKLGETMTSFDLVKQVTDRTKVDTVVLGSVMKAGDTIRISIKIEEAATGKILSSHQVDAATEADLFAEIDSLSRQIRRNLDLEPAGSPLLRRGLAEVTTSSLDAYRAYVEGRQLHNQGKYTDAISHYLQAVALDSDFGMAWAALARVHKNLRLPEAAELAHRAFQLRERLTLRERFTIEGEYYSYRAKTWGQSIEAFEQALAHYPDHAPARRLLALVYFCLERYEDSIRLTRESLAHDSDFLGGYDNLALAHAALGEFEEAEQILRQLLERHPDNILGLEGLGWLFNHWGKLDQARDFFDRSALLRPSSFYHATGRWELAILEEDWAAADETLKHHFTAETASQDTFYAILYRYLTTLHQGRSQEALDLAGEWIGTSSNAAGQDRASIRNFTARLLLDLGMPAEALEQAEASQLDGADGLEAFRGRFFAALAHLALDQPAAAQSIAEQLAAEADLIPSDLEQRRYRHLLGELALARGDARSAVKELERAESMLPPRGRFLQNHQPEHVPIWSSLASAYRAAGDDGRAEQTLLKIISCTTERVIHPTAYVRSFYRLGEIHRARGDVERAKKYYRRFLAFWEAGDVDRERVAAARRHLTL